MHLAYRVARRARDARFDGRFFIGVTSTGIYCRPVCPAPSPKEEHVRYFPSAAAAAAAGFRPCLRCRPEASPGTPAWLGATTTVSRALRLIGEGALDENGVEELATNLGIGSRHLRRLFLQHLGATPVEVAQTRRLHFAKQLIDETRLPFTQIAMASGFGSVRRFNATFLSIYGRAPSRLRGLGRRDGRARGEYRFRLSFRPPLDWNALISFLGRRATPGVEWVADEVYGRTISLDGQAGQIEARLADDGGAVELRIAFPTSRGLLRIVERARRVFDLGADPAAIADSLSGDPLLRSGIARRPGLRVPGAWDGFEIAVRAILGQQVSVAAARTLAGRLVDAYGESFAINSTLRIFPTPQKLVRADLTKIGVVRTRADAIRALARAAVRGDLSFTSITDPAAFAGALQQLPGVGAWTAEYIIMRLGEPDAFPAGDLMLIRASGAASARELRDRAEAWRPWRAYAAIHLWQRVGDDAKHDADRLLHAHRKPARTAAAGR